MSLVCHTIGMSAGSIDRNKGIEGEGVTWIRKWLLEGWRIGKGRRPASPREREKKEKALRWQRPQRQGAI